MRLRGRRRESRTLFSGEEFALAFLLSAAANEKSRKKSQSDHFKSLWRSVECEITFRTVRNGSFDISKVLLKYYLTISHICLIIYVYSLFV